MTLDPNVKSKDVELWQRWKRTRDPGDLQLLLRQMEPIIQREVNKWAPSASRSYLEGQARRLAVQAFETYDPNAGAALSTYLASRLPKLSRPVYATQNAARMPETQSVLFHTFNHARMHLEDVNGRPPTTVELADHLAWEPKRVSEFQRIANRKEYIESEEHPDADDTQDHLVDYIYHDLSPQQKLIFEHSTGYGGAKVLSSADAAKKLKITPGQHAYQKSLIVKTVEQAQRKHGR